MQRIVLAALALIVAPWVSAQEPVKVGLVAPFSGPQGDYGKQMEAGIKAFFKLHGDTFAGRKIQVLVRDTGGPNPEIAKRLSQGLVARDNGDFLAGYGFSPEAMARAPAAPEAKKPAGRLNAG